VAGVVNEDVGSEQDVDHVGKDDVDRIVFERVALQQHVGGG
jgi:hypothetical protein